MSYSTENLMKDAQQLNFYLDAYQVDCRFEVIRVGTKSNVYMHTKEGTEKVYSGKNLDCSLFMDAKYTELCKGM